MEGVYKLLIQLGDILQPFVLFVFRLYWGWQFFLTGQGKLQNHQSVVEFFASLNIPAPSLNAWFVGGLECFGGLMLVIGVLSRPIALMLTINMLVAYFAVESDRIKLLNVFSDPEPFIAADPFFFLLMSILVLSFGPGKISIDAIFKKIWLGE